jgi:hypothetical protein
MCWSKPACFKEYLNRNDYTLEFTLVISRVITHRLCMFTELFAGFPDCSMVVIKEVIFCFLQIFTWLSVV